MLSMDNETSILIVDDNLQLLHAVQATLQQAGYTVLAATDGLMALEMMRAACPDLIIADITMPHMNGYQLHERVRQNAEWLLVPFIFLTGRAMDSDIRYGREIGADDYLVKPIEPEDLLVAVRGKLKRAQQWSQHRLVLRAHVEPELGMITFGALRINPAQRCVELDGDAIVLSAKEFALLECLARRSGEVVQLHELIHATHDLKTDRNEAGDLLRPLIRSLRRKLGYPVGDLGCIETVRGIGYRLLPPVR